jgi:hypothetical protein
MAARGLSSPRVVCVPVLDRHDWIWNGQTKPQVPTAPTDLPKTASMSDALGLRRPLDPELLFDALHREAVDYVVIGGFASSAHSATQSVETIELTIDRTIDNCIGCTEVLVNVDAWRVLSFRDRKPVDRDAPMRILDGEFRFDTAAGGINLRLPRRVFGCPDYPELRASSICLRLADGAEARTASLDHLREIEHAFDLDSDAGNRRSLRSSGREMVSLA